MDKTLYDYDLDGLPQAPVAGNPARPFAIPATLRRLVLSACRPAVIATIAGLDLMTIGIVFQIRLLLSEAYWQIPAVLTVIGFTLHGTSHGWQRTIAEVAEFSMKCTAINTIIMSCISIALFSIHAHPNQNLIIAMAVASLVLVGIALVPYLLFGTWSDTVSPAPRREPPLLFVSERKKGTSKAGKGRNHD